MVLGRACCSLGVFSDMACHTCGRTAACPSAEAQAGRLGSSHGWSKADTMACNDRSTTGYASLFPIRSGTWESGRRSGPETKYVWGVGQARAVSAYMHRQ